MTSTIDVPVRDVMSGIELRVTFPTSLRWRLRAATWLIGLAGRIAGFGVIIEAGRAAPADLTRGG